MGEAFTTEILIGQAKEVMASLLGDSGQPVSVEMVFREDILKALATLEHLDHSAFVIIKEKLRQAKIPLRELDRGLKPHRALHIVHSVEPEQQCTAGSYLNDAPLPNLIIPPPYLLSPDATLIMHQGSDPDEPPYEQTLAYAPLLITGRLQHIDDLGQWLRLEWKRGSTWHTQDIDRGIAMNAQKLIELASQGFPVASDNVSNVARYLHELEAVNYQNLPTAQMATRLGWQGEQGAYGFLCGRTLARADEMLTIDDLSSVATRDWQPNWIAFHGSALGDDQIVQGFHHRGTYEAWCEAIQSIIPYDKVRLGLYAAFAAPLLEILHVPNFVIDWSARTSSGKTTTLRTIASVWGCPDERQPDSIIFSWNATKVWSERAAAVLNGLPFILDESKLAAKGVVPSVLYMVANGIGKGRGNPKGLAQGKRWRTILFSTGESPVTSFTEEGGSRMRCLTIRGYPFGATTPETLKVVGELTSTLQMNYGHAGPRFAQWILQHREEWPTWQKRYAKQKTHLMKLSTDEAAYRLADYGAVIALTAELVHEALNLPWEQSEAISSELWRMIVDDASGASGDIRALRHIMSWAHAHQEAFEGRHVRDAKDQTPKSPSGGWAGVWPQGEQGTIGILPHILDQVLEEGNFDPTAIKEVWRENGWLILETGRKTFVKRQRLFGELTRLMSIDLAKADPESNG
jgi:putative DNA primase/helicase